MGKVGNPRPGSFSPTAGDFGFWLRETRLANNPKMSQHGLAKALHNKGFKTSQREVSYYETRDIVPPADVVRALEEILGCKFQPGESEESKKSIPLATEHRMTTRQMEEKKLLTTEEKAKILAPSAPPVPESKPTTSLSPLEQAAERLMAHDDKLKSKIEELIAQIDEVRKEIDRLNEDRAAVEADINALMRAQEIMAMESSRK